jgi:GT2 family glycosyltransferase
VRATGCSAATERQGHVALGTELSALNDERFRFAAIARLYLVVQGRPPDIAGLRTYMDHLAAGSPLETIARAFVESGEFRARVAGRDPLSVLCEQALGENASQAPPAVLQAASLAQAAAALVLWPAVQERLPILSAMFPDGVPMEPEPYRTWLLGRPSPTPSIGPSISFVLLLDRPDPALLAETVRSVPQGAGVQLVAAGRWPVAPEVRRVLHGRARLVLGLPGFMPGTGQAGLFNRALARCTGDFTALLGQHDVLDASAASLPGRLGSADIAIADDDRIDAAGHRSGPRLGAAWDPDRAAAAGEWPGLVMFRTALLRAGGGMRACAGREEWAMLLRAAARGAVAHIPLVALSRRALAERATMQTPQLDAASAFLSQVGETGRVERAGPLLRVVHDLPAPPPMASVIIPTRDRADLLRRCVEGLLGRTDYPALEVILVDNGSTEPAALELLAVLAQDARVRVLREPGPFNWSALNNAGVAAMRGTFALLLNNDIDVLHPGWLREMVSQAARPGVGVVGAKLLYGTAPGYLDQLQVTRRVAALTGACLVLRRDLYTAVGGCEAAALPVTWSDVDLCFKLRQRGLHAVWTPHARLLHLEQASRGSDETPENRARHQRERAWMASRWGDWLDCDPYRNPNLLPSETDLRLVTRFDWASAR